MSYKLKSLYIFKLLVCIFIIYIPSHVVADSVNWEHFKLKFISEDGRVIDTGNGNVSHSEGQGLGMLFAVAHDDQITFNKVWQWTKTNLDLREDGLFVWQWVPDKENHTEDFGSATDGDIFIAWAMARAAEKWKNPSYLEIAKSIVKAIRTQLVVEIDGDTLLLPGPVWPRRDRHTTINLSYWIYPAFQEFSKIDASPQWEKLIQTGIDLIRHAQFGAWDLPADWMAIKNDGSFSQVEEFPFVFGYEAVRIPLYYLWGGYNQKDLLRVFQAFWAATEKGSKLVTMLGLATDSVIQQEAVLAYRAVSDLVECAISQKPASFVGKSLSDYDDYYSSAIYLIAQLVVEERMPYCKEEGLITDINYACIHGDNSQCPLPDPIPEKIEKGSLIVRVEDFIRIPPTRTSRPLVRINFLTHANDRSGRMYVNDEDGKVYIIQDGKLLSEPLIDIARIRGQNFIAGAAELGLLSIAFHPDFSKPDKPGFGLLYTAHTEISESTSTNKDVRVFPSPADKIDHYNVISEWKVDPENVNKVMPGLQRELLRIAQPENHHCIGQLGFDPTLKKDDPEYGILYISIGDGGWNEYLTKSPYRLSQDLGNPLGKILRINPTSGTDQKEYVIPENNPFINSKDILPEIWAYGLRDPQRFSWDSNDGKMYIADIGQNNIEEINIGVSGANYGWQHREGSFAVDYSNYKNVLPLPPNDSTWDFAYPVLQYDHDEGNEIGGGFVYQGKLLPELHGRYVFNDLMNGRVFHVDASDLIRGKVKKIEELRLYYNGAEKTFLEILNDDSRADLRLGVDENGELYALSKRDGMVRRLLPMQKGETVN